MSSKQTNRKRIAGVVALVIALALLLGGTFAYVNLNQHKSDEFGGMGLKYDATLIEDFQEKTNWTTEDPDVSKIVAAKNAGIANSEYGNVLIRLQLKEYMEIGPVEDVFSTQRYMIDTSGDFITFATQAAAEAAYPDHVVVPDRAIGETVDSYYIVTQAKDDNGQYGKFLLKDVIADGNAESLVAGVNRASDEASGTTHHDDSNGECAYTPHSWAAGQGDSEAFREYVEWKLGADTVLLSDWNGTTKNIWVLDDSKDGGYAYWIGELAPTERTSDLLESTSLVEQPNGTFYYAIHTEMDAISPDQITTWTDVPTAVRAALTEVPTPKIAGATAVTVRRGATQDFNLSNMADTDVAWTVSPFSANSSVNANGVLTVGAHETATDLTVVATVIGDPTKTTSVAIRIPTVESVSINTLKNDDYVARGETYYLSATVTGKHLTAADKTVTWSCDSTQGSVVSPTLGTLQISGSEVANSTFKITATTTAAGNPAKTANVTVHPIAPGDIIRPFVSDSVDYRILRIDKSGHALVVRLPLVDVGEFSDTTPYPGYSGSKLESRMTTFYNTLSTADKSKVQKVKLVTEDAYAGNEAQWGNTWNNYALQTDTGLSYVDPDGAQMAFALSISEVNIGFGLPMGYANNPDRVIDWQSAPYTWWLRGPGGNANSAAAVGGAGHVSSATVTGTYGVRPALWIHP